MAKVYSYEDFENAAKKAGLYDSFSDADLRLARSNADAGMSILQYKQDYAGAKDDAAKQAANQGAENIRRQYGYTGGTDGSKFYAAAPQSGAYQPSDAVQQAQAMLNQQLANKPGNYQSQWQQQLSQTMDKILNREGFSYDLNGDALYQQYKDQYTQQGKMAMMDTMGQASAMTGGYGNSYAQSVGQQAYQGQLQQLNDKVPELYQLALNRYNAEGDALANQYALLAAQENQDYARYRDGYNDWLSEVSRLQSRYDSERAQDYGQYQDERSYQYQLSRDQAEDQRYQQQLQYQQDRDKISDQQWQAQLEYQKGRDQMEDQRYQQQYDDARADAEYERSYAMALLKAQYGDYSGLRELGIAIPEEEETTGGYYYSGNPDVYDDPGEDGQHSTAYTPKSDVEIVTYGQMTEDLQFMKQSSKYSYKDMEKYLRDARSDGSINSEQYDFLRKQWIPSGYGSR